MENFSIRYIYDRKELLIEEKKKEVRLLQLEV